MRTKTLLRISAFLAIPMFLSMLANLLFALAYMNGKGLIEMQKLNHPFVMWGAIIGLFCGVFIFVTTFSFLKFADRMDSIDKAEEKYLKAKEEMEIARNKFTEMLIDKNK